MSNQSIALDPAKVGNLCSSLLVTPYWLTSWSATSKACCGLLCCRCMLVTRSWWRAAGLAPTNTSAASRWSSRELRARWRCWGWRWRGSATGGSGGWCTDEGHDSDDCTERRGSSSLAPLLCRHRWLSGRFGPAQPRPCRRRAGSVRAAGWPWSGGSSLACRHWRGWHGYRRDCHYAAERYQKPTGDKDGWRVDLPYFSTRLSFLNV